MSQQAIAPRRGSYNEIPARPLRRLCLYFTGIVLLARSVVRQSVGGIGILATLLWSGALIYAALEAGKRGAA